MLRVLTVERTWRQSNLRGSGRIEMDGTQNAKQALVRVFALALALMSVLMLAQALAHSHAKGESEAACHICHAAQLGAAPTAGVELLSSPILAADKVEVFVPPFHQEFFFHDCASRAPPSA